MTRTEGPFPPVTPAAGSSGRDRADKWPILRVKPSNKIDGDANVGDLFDTGYRPAPVSLSFTPADLELRVGIGETELTGCGWDLHREAGWFFHQISTMATL